jgi:hypothetical protein
MSVMVELTDEELLEIRTSMQHEDDALAVQAVLREYLKRCHDRRLSKQPQGTSSPNEALLALAGQDILDPSSYIEQRQASME